VLDRCLGVSECGGKRHNTTLAITVNNDWSAFMPADRRMQSLVVSSKKKTRFKPLNQNIQRNLAARILAKIEEGGVRGAVRLAVGDDSLAPCTDDTIDALHQLHPWPAAPVNGSFSPPDTDVIYVNDLTLDVQSMLAEDITETIKSLPMGSDGGLDG
jgi:hypothetical protein